jgi:translation initiation factor IF-3
LSSRKIQLRPNIDHNDLLMVKAKRAQGFLNDGDKVKVVLRFKGREITHTDLGRTVVQNFLDNLIDYKLERPVGMSERQLLLATSLSAKNACQLKKLQLNCNFNVDP